jgi:hypothetical protein
VCAAIKCSRSKSLIMSSPSLRSSDYGPHTCLHRPGVPREEAAFAKFRRALRDSDKLVLDDLFASARQHLAAAAYASHVLPFETMLLEEHKEVIRLRRFLEEIRGQQE